MLRGIAPSCFLAIMVGSMLGCITVARIGRCSVEPGPWISRLICSRRSRSIESPSVNSESSTNPSRCPGLGPACGTAPVGGVAAALPRVPITSTRLAPRCTAGLSGASWRIAPSP
jgi:hypothetical protein